MANLEGKLKQPFERSQPDIQEEYDQMLATFNQKVKPADISEQIALIRRIIDTPQSQRPIATDDEALSGSASQRGSNRSRLRKNKMD
jgi:type IV secretory pathway VirB4 component